MLPWVSELIVVANCTSLHSNPSQLQSTGCIKQPSTVQGTSGLQHPRTTIQPLVLCKGWGEEVPSSTIFDGPLCVIAAIREEDAGNFSLVVLPKFGEVAGEL